MLLLTALGKNQPAANRQLLQQGRRDMGRGCCQHDSIKRRSLGKTQQSIGVLQLNIGEPKPPQPGSGTGNQWSNPLDRIHLACQPCQNGGLVAATGADFEHLAQI